MAGLRILHVIPSVAVDDGGPARAIARMERGLTAQGVSVTTLASDYAPNGPLPAASSSRVYKRLLTHRYKIAPGMVPYLWRHVRDFDAVHIHALFSFAATAAAWCARSRGVPYIVRPLGTLGHYGMKQRRPLLKRLSIAAVETPILRHAAAVHFTSAAEWQEAGEVVDGLRPAVIPLGVDAPERPSPEAAARLAQRLGGRKPILFLSRLDRKKNVESLIEAVGRSEILRAGSALVIAGGGDPTYRWALERQAREMGLADIVRWLGHVEGDERAAAFAAADVFVLPSYSENFGIAAVEAMMAGLPCVLTSGIAIAREAAEAGAVEMSEPHAEALRAALERLIQDDDLRRLRGAHARRFAQDRYSVDSMAQRLCELYRDVKRVNAP